MARWGPPTSRVGAGGSRALPRPLLRTDPAGRFDQALLFRPTTVYRPQRDTWLLAEALEQETFTPVTRVLDLCTGTGALAIAAARLGAGHVTAVDISRRATIAAWINTRIRGLEVRVVHGDLFGPLEGERFDVIVANPPYVPAAENGLPASGAARCWDAGKDGRALLDRISNEAPARLVPGGILLLVFSSVCGEDLVLEQLVRAGLDAAVINRYDEPFGPVMSSRADLLEERGLVVSGQRHEELVVVRARCRP